MHGQHGHPAISDKGLIDGFEVYLQNGSNTEYWLLDKANDCNRLVVSKNIGIETPFAIVALYMSRYIIELLIFCQNCVMPTKDCGQNW